MEEFKLGDRFYAPWGNGGTGDCFMLFDNRYDWSEPCYKIRWDRYDADRHLRSGDSATDHDGIVTLDCLLNSNIGSNAIYKIENDKHLLELILKHG